MGGFGSGLKERRKPVVEDGLTLSISRLLEAGVLVPGSLASCRWGWAYPGRPTYFHIDVLADLRDSTASTMRLEYQAMGEAIRYDIKLTTTMPRLGGSRWWFACPIVREDGGPPLRVAKLHLPPGQRYFGSRLAHGLTYTSCRERGRYLSLYRFIAARMGTNEATIRRVLNEDYRQRACGTGAAEHVACRLRFKRR